VRLRPGATCADAPVAKQKLRGAVAQTREIRPHLLTRANEIAGRLEAGRWHRERYERAGQKQADEQLGVLAIGLDPIPLRSTCTRNLPEFATYSCRLQSHAIFGTRGGYVVGSRSPHTSTLPTEYRASLDKQS
jgi:hypothetical protein